MRFGITQQIGSILLLFVVFVAGGMLASFAVVSIGDHDAIVINVAGRQRLLIEKMSNLSFRILRGEGTNMELRERAATFEQAADGLVFGNRDLDLPSETDAQVLRALQDVRDEWSRFRPNVETIAADGPRFLEAFRSVVDQTDALVASSQSLPDADRANIERLRADLVLAATPLVGNDATRSARASDALRIAKVEDVQTSAAILHRSTLSALAPSDAAARARFDAFAASWKALAPKIELLLRLQRTLQDASTYVETNDDHLLQNADLCVRIFEKRAAARQHRLVIFQLGLAVAGAIAAFVAFLLVRRIIVRPLRRIIEVTAHVGQEIPDLSLEASRPDEIGQLARSFVVMAERLSDTVAGLISTAKSQELLARSQELLARTSATLDMTIEDPTLVEEVVKLFVPQLGDACVLLIAQTEGRASTCTVRHRDPDAEKALRALRLRSTSKSRVEQELERAYRTGRSRAFNDPTLQIWQDRSPDDVADATLRELQLDGSYVCIPIRAHDRFVGALLFASSDSRYDDDAERRLIEGVGERLALALENMHLYAASVDAVRLREEIIALVSHDLRSPINVIQMEAMLLEELMPEALREEATEALDAIRSASDRMTRLTTNLLDVASIQRGRISLECEMHETKGLVDEAIKALAPLAKNKGVALVSEAPAHCRAWCDPDRVQQVLANLLGNALKFSASGKKISVTVSRDESDATFTVKDEGAGIRPEHIDRIFDPYWTSTTRGVRGTGLGLYIARGIVEAHAGRLWVTSVLGSGSSFSFTLPLTSRKAKAPAISSSAALPDA